MFDSIRSHRRWLMFFMLVLIFPSFVFFGIQGYNTFIEKEGGLATVDGAPVTQQEFDTVLRERADRLKASLGDSFDPRLLETPEARATILEQLVLDRALSNEARKSNIIVSDERLRAVIAGIPAFQEDGKFSAERYKAFLAAQGMTGAMFDQRVREDLRKQALVQAVVESAIVPKQVGERVDRLLLEQREVRELRLAAEQFLSTAKIGDAQITEFYEQNRRLFETPENVKIEYLVLSPATIAGAGSVAEADVRAYYDQNKARYGTEEQRRASHILISTEGSDKAAARKKAEEILAKVRARPADFEKLAREHSKDTGSAAQGGDLGFFGRGMMVKPFEDAAFGMKEGETSDVVETDFGAHIIRLTSIKPAQSKPFEEVRADIERDLRQQQAQKRFAEAADQFTNLVYEQADSLQPAADKLKLKVQTIEVLTRQGLPPLMNARVIEALFSEDSLKGKRNTQAIEVATNTLVSARVLEHRPAAVRPLEQVKPQINELLTRREAVRLAREAGEARLAELRKQPSDAGFQPARWISRQQPQGLPPSAVNQILRVPADKLPSFVGVELENAGFLIAHVLSSREGSGPDAQQREAQARVLAQQAAGADELAYADGLKARHKVAVLKPELKRDTVRTESKAPSAPAEKK